VTLVGGFVGQDRWVLDTSVFHHMASAPAVLPDWRADLVMAAVGLAATLAGAAAFRRRDLRGP
jgi:ABC-2 type transport system permease protein